MATILSQARSAIEDAFPKKPTPEQLKVSAPMREAQRKRMIEILDRLSTETSRKEFTDLGALPFYIKTLAWVKSEVAWWNVNIELTPEAVEKRTKVEEEYLLNLEKEYNDLRIKSREKTQQAVKEKQTKQEAVLNRSWSDDLSDAVQYALGFAGAIFWILLGIRLGGLLANDLLYKPVAYRALAFIYSFFFLPFLLPYWAYREIKYLFFKSADLDAPHFESIFPVVPYNPSEPLTLEKRLYGYPDTPALSGWIARKRQQEEESWIGVLGGNLLEKLMKQREDEKKA